VATDQRRDVRDVARHPSRIEVDRTQPVCALEFQPKRYGVRDPEKPLAIHVASRLKRTYRERITIWWE